MIRSRPRAALLAATLAAATAASALTASTAQAVVGDPATDGTYAFTAELAIGDNYRGCTGALIAPQWIATAASCFATDPAQPETVAAGKPSHKTTATIGRTDLNSTTGAVDEIVELVPYPGRDLVLARLAKPTSGIVPVALATAAPATGETLKAAGYGRTKTQWVPDQLHSSPFSVESAADTHVNLASVEGTSAICAGDTGGPVLRENGGTVELVAVSSRSWQGGCFNSEETRTGAMASRVDSVTEWINTTVTASAVTDFNCDGARDVAIADPDATVSSYAKAGRVQVVYGGGKGNVEMSQALSAVSGAPETGDRYGASLATFDHDLDGCTDLAVGSPGEAIGTETGAGAVTVLYGSPDGLAQGKATLPLHQGAGTGALAALTAQAGDRFGEALAAGTTTTGEPYLAIGAPGEDAAGGLTDAGGVSYLHGTGTTNVLIHQDKAGVPGAMEKDDAFGSALAASPQHLAIGAPGEAIGTTAGAGGVAIFNHTLNADKIPTGIAGVDQDLTEIEGGAETGDQFGAALALVPYRAGATAAGNESLLAIGTPSEDSSTVKDAGRVDVLKVTISGFTQLSGIHQGTANVTGDLEDGDVFGSRLSAVATEPGKVSTTQNSRLAVGVPGEDAGTTVDAGSVYTFGLLGAPGDSDVPVYPGKVGLPGAPVAGEKVGSAFTATGTHLYVGIPDGPSAYGRVHTVPWANITSAATDTVTTYQPGQDGLPATGQSFGAAIR